MRRREFVQGLAALLCPFASAVAAQPETIRIGLTPVFLDDQASFLNAWLADLESTLQRPVRFLQRGSYREITDMLIEQKLDFAWICGYPYVRNRKLLRLLAVPVFNGRPTYQSYLIVPATDTRTRSILDLRGKVFAFSDPDSNSGFLYPTYSLMKLNERPETFFGKTFFTWAHRKVVEAVGAGLAQGGAVDSYVWETLRLLTPELTARTRVVDKSPPFGHTPFVARSRVSAADFAAMQKALLDMGSTPSGTVLLRRLNLDGFARADDSLYAGIAEMARVVNGAAGHAPPA